MARSKSKALVQWDKELAKQAEQQASKEDMPGGQFISLRAGQMSIGGNPVKGNSLKVVIVDSIFENALYRGKFDPDNQQSPVCFALAHDKDDLKPHENSADPQHDQCEGCEMNEFESSDTGRGKACGNRRRLAVLSADRLTEDSVKAGDILFLKIPVTSVKGWAYYVKALNTNYRRPPHGMITEISVIPDTKSQFKLSFTPIEPVEDDVMGAIMERRDEVTDTIMFPYQKADLDAIKKAGKKDSKKSKPRRAKY